MNITTLPGFVNESLEAFEFTDNQWRINGRDIICESKDYVDKFVGQFGDFYDLTVNENTVTINEAKMNGEFPKAALKELDDLGIKYTTKKNKLIVKSTDDAEDIADALAGMFNVTIDGKEVMINEAHMPKMLSNMKSAVDFVNEAKNEKIEMPDGDIARHALAEKLSGSRFAGGARVFRGSEGAKRLQAIIDKYEDGGYVNEANKMAMSYKLKAKDKRDAERLYFDNVKQEADIKTFISDKLGINWFEISSYIDNDIKPFNESKKPAAPDDEQLVNEAKKNKTEFKFKGDVSDLEKQIGDDYFIEQDDKDEETYHVLTSSTANQVGSFHFDGKRVTLLDMPNGIFESYVNEALNSNELYVERPFNKKKEFEAAKRFKNVPKVPAPVTVDEIEGEIGDDSTNLFIELSNGTKLEYENTNFGGKGNKPLLHVKDRYGNEAYPEVEKYLGSTGTVVGDVLLAASQDKSKSMMLNETKTFSNMKSASYFVNEAKFSFPDELTFVKPVYLTSIKRPNERIASSFEWNLTEDRRNDADFINSGWTLKLQPGSVSGNYAEYGTGSNARGFGQTEIERFKELGAIK